VRILVTTNAAMGHFRPLAPTVAQLLIDGHEVRIGCPERFAPIVREAHFEPLPCAEIPVSLDVAAIPSTDDPEARLIWAITQSWPQDCRSWLDSLLGHLAQWRPDVIVAEPVEHAGRVAAAVLQVPLIVHGWGFTLPAGVETVAAGAIANVYKQLGTAPLEPTLTVDLGIGSIQAPDAGDAQRYRYQPFSLAYEAQPPQPTAKHRVLVTLGTYPDPRAAEVIRTVAGAALETGAEVIAVLGNDDRQSEELFLPGVKVLKWVDMAAAVRASDLVVHHGGAGTSWTCLSVGRPALILPLAGDQFRNAGLIASAGAGLVSSRTADSQELAAVIDGALKNPTIGRRASEVAQENAELPGLAVLTRDISGAVTRHHCQRWS
jgi:UDP:flavonoid glycosyltransferase YjiC (YdhE family)